MTDLAEMPDDKLIQHHRRVCARLGVRNSGLVICPFADPPEPDYAGEIQRRLGELRKLKADQEAFLLHLVDVVWGTAYEDGQVPSTPHAREMIAEARHTFKAGS